MSSISSAYYFALCGGYATGLLGWWLIYRWKPGIWNADPVDVMLHPWWETLWALLAAVATVAIGQMYSAGMLLPNSLFLGPIFTEALNQLIIFSPFLILLGLRRQPLTTAWLPSHHLVARLLVGVLLAAAAICAFVLIRQPADSLGTIVGNICHAKNAGYAVQIFLEEVAIAVIFVRFRAAVGERWFLIVLMTVAFLFSASHYPAKLAEGLSLMGATREVFIDAALVSTVIYFLQRSRDIVWFWFVHFAMDMMQFYTGNVSL